MSQIGFLLKLGLIGSCLGWCLFQLRSVVDIFRQQEKSEKTKFLYLTLMYFFLIGSYTIVKEFKNSMFISIVGIDSLPAAKILAMIALVPSILFYSYLVDRLKRYQLLVFYSLFYSVFILMFGYFLSNPEIGIVNPEASPYRLYGWFFYFLIEGFSPFIVGVFWSFTNSICDPESAKKNYSLMVSGSKLGGMFTSGFAWYYLSQTQCFGYSLTELSKHQALFVMAAILLFLVPICAILLIKRVPARDLHGYEAAYKVDQLREHKAKAKGYWNKFVDFFHSLFDGLWMLIKQPYVLGIFGMIFFFEGLNVVLDLLRLTIAKDASGNISELNCILFEQMFYIHLIGFVIALFGTGLLLRKFGERRCLLLIPITTGLLVLLLLVNIHFGDYQIVNVVTFVYIGIRAINYAITYPVRESLYIPTVKEIKFKSKSWIDAFGTKFSKSTGSVFNIFARNLPYAYTIFFSLIIFLWTVTAYLLGKRFEKAIKNNEVIGE